MESSNAQIQQQVDRITDPYYWVAWFVCLIPFAILGATVFAYQRIRQAARMIYAAKFSGTDSTDEQEVAAEPLGQEPAEKSIAVPTVSVSESETAADRAFSDWPLFEVGEISRIELKRGCVVCRFYRQQRMVKGKLIPTAAAAKRILGGSVQLGPVSCDSLEAAVALMQEQAERILDSAKSARKSPSPRGASAVPAIQAGTAGVPMIGELIRSDEFDDIPVFPPSDCEPVEFERLQDDPFSGLDSHAVPSGAEGREELPVKKSVPRTGQVSYQGVVQTFGLVDRWIPKDEKDPNSKKKKVEHFRIRLLDEELQTEQDHWGADLERAIRDSGVQVGDRVQIAVVGTTPVMVKGRTRTKKVWALTRL